MAFSFILQGLRSTILDAAVQANDGRVYLEVSYQELAGFGPGRVEEVSSKEKLDDFIKEEIARYHGKIIGKKSSYQFNNIFDTVTLEVAENLLGNLDL